MIRNKEESSRVRGEGEFGNHSCGSRRQALPEAGSLAGGSFQGVQGVQGEDSSGRV